MQQKRVMPDRREQHWDVDIDALRKALPNLQWLKDRTAVLTRDLSEMATYLPHWIISVGKDQQAVKSSCCRDNIIPANGALRCLYCQQPCRENVTALIWTGLLPVNLTGRAQAREKLARARAAGRLHYPIITPQGKEHLLVPIIVEYPHNWPLAPPIAYYADQQFINALKIKRGHHTHLYGERTMCLFAGLWNDSSTIMQIIANRIAPHALALLRMADGEDNIGYFHASANDYDDYYDR